MKNFFIINSPLDQFEIRDLFRLDVPMLGDMLYSLTNIVELLNLISSTIPYMLHIYLPARHLINKIRMPQIGCSADFSNSSEKSDIASDQVGSLLIELPYTYIVRQPSYQFYMVLLEFIDLPFIRIILIGLFAFILKLVGIFSIRILNTNSFFFILFTLLLFLPGALAYEPHMGITIYNPFFTYTIITSVLFFLANFMFDYYSAQHRLREVTFFNSNIITRIILGMLYLFNITAGVFSTNGTWYLLDNFHTPLITILTTLGSVVFPMVWFILGIENRLIDSFIINSGVRAYLEVCSFNCVAFSTYMYWDFWVTHVTVYTNIIAFVLFTVLLVPVGFITIHLESQIGRGRGLWYGTSYLLTFTCIAMSTNSLYALISDHILIGYINIILAIITSLFTVILYPDVYRAGILMTRSNLAHVLLSNYEILNRSTGFAVFTTLQHLILFYFVFFCFVLYTGLFFVYIYRWLTSL